MSAAYDPTPVRVLVADPPWRFGDKLPGPGRGAAKHYDTMTVDEIAAMAIPPVADDALLCLWRVASMVPEAYRVCAAWGFVAKTELVWRKLSKTGGSLHFGMGRTLRAAHETCVIATRGRFKPANLSTRSIFDAPVGVHSEKPAEFYRIVESLSDGPRAELFSRRTREGWATYGNEVGKLDGGAR